MDDGIRQRGRALRKIEGFERRVQGFVQEALEKRRELASDEELTEETKRALSELDSAFEEALESNRLQFIDEIRHEFQPLTGDVPSKVYEEIAFGAVSDRLTRYFGYYQGIQRAIVQTENMNNDVGDRVFEVSGPNLTKLFARLDEVYFVRTVGIQLGLMVSDVDKIVDYVIEREFRRKSGS